MIQADSQFQHLPRPSRGMPHAFGDRLVLHSFPYPISLLRRLCSPATVQPAFNQGIERLYDFLTAEVASLELATTPFSSETRMVAHNPEGVFQGEVIAMDQQVVVVDIARAGILPAHRFFMGLHEVLPAENLRTDHIFMNRATNEKGEVTGVNFTGCKIGGPVAGRTVIIPDPMGATGGSLLATMEHYRRQPGGAPARFIAVNLIVTPEYVRRVLREAPDVTIHAIRLDRGLSHPDAFSQLPGSCPELERGLNDHQYIVPGGGGFGELINNALT